MDLPLGPVSTILILASLSSCGSSLPETSSLLEPTTQAEQLPKPEIGKICWFATDPHVLMFASGRDAVVRFHGRPLLLRFEGDRLRAGGTFRGPGLTVSVDDVPQSPARSEAPFDADVKVSVEASGRSERFKALWVCQGRDFYQ